MLINYQWFIVKTTVSVRFILHPKRKTETITRWILNKNVSRKCICQQSDNSPIKIYKKNQSILLWYKLIIQKHKIIMDMTRVRMIHMKKTVVYTMMTNTIFRQMMVLKLITNMIQVKMTFRKKKKAWILKMNMMLMHINIIIMSEKYKWIIWDQTWREQEKSQKWHRNFLGRWLFSATE